MKKPGYILIILLLVFLPSKSIADEPSGGGETLSLDTNHAISMALDNNDLVKAAEHMVMSARAEGEARYAPFLPQLTTTYSYTRIDKAPTSTFNMGEGPVSIKMGTVDNYEWAFQLVFPIYTGGAKPAAKKLVVLNEETAKNNLDIARRGISFGVTEAYYGLLATKKLVDVRDASLKYITEAHDNALKMQREGFFPASDVLQVEVAKGRAEMDLRAAMDMERTLQMSLKQMLGISSDTQLKLTEPYEKPSTEKFERTKLLELAEKRNGELREIDFQIRMAEQWLRVYKAGDKPNLNLVGRYTNQGDTPLVSGNGLSDPNTLTVTLQLSWTLFDSKKVENQKKQLEESIEALKLRKKDASEKLRISLESALDDYLRAVDNINVSSRNLDSAKENFRVLNERYKEGLERSLNLLEGEALLATATLQYNQSIYDSYRSLAKIAMIVGFETTDEFVKVAIN